MQLQFEQAVSKHMSTALGEAVASGLQHKVVPGFERACQEMFKQVHVAMKDSVTNTLAGFHQEIFSALDARLDEVRFNVEDTRRQDPSFTPRFTPRFRRRE